MATWDPPPVGSIRQVTSIPFVAPATWTNRSRRVAGSLQVRARQATGRPSPRTPTSGTARDEVDDERPVGPALDLARPSVVGEQPLPALDVPGEREDEVGRGGDVDGDRAVHRVRSRAAASGRPSGELAEMQPLRLVELNQAHVSVEPSTSSRSSPPVIRTR